MMGYDAAGKHKRVLYLAVAIVRRWQEGEAEMALQAYYLRGNAQTLVDTSGTAVNSTNSSEAVLH